ncbi:cyclase [Mycobacterium sp. GA-1285]|uniref:SRPBCC family protein n=1 Tax=Mycobacterium sp. GA-1285 TaxID=1772282 RepID=UPI0007486969|nr:SRPBCC family protein [Mycobacterium sp. GA-1285]KUI23014.1 cyclase [Mycobacterium sp. GA-1285]
MATQTKRNAHDAKATNGAGALQESLQRLAGSMTDRAVNSVSGRLSGASSRLTHYAENGGGLLSAVTGKEGHSSPVKTMLKAGVGGAAGKVKDSVKGAAESLTNAVGGKGGKGGGQKLKVTNIVEQIEVGVPIDVAYDQWTQFSEFPKFMKKVENVEQVSDEKLEWKAQVFLSHRTWESTIVEQVPNDRIVWKSKGAKGYVDGAVTFHELAPDLTRIIVILEYHPQGFFEKTGNLWRAPGRRIRLELKHFQRHVMTDTILHPDDVEGWRGEIRDGEVVSSDNADTDEQDSKPATRRRKGAPRNGSGGSKPSHAREQRGTGDRSASSRSGARRPSTGQRRFAPKKSARS